MKKVILITNDAEACGKTTLSQVLCGHLQRKGVQYKLAITSPDQELPIPAHQFDIEEGLRAGDLVDLIDHTDALVIEVHTGGAQRFLREFSRHRLDDVFEELQAELTVVLPVCEDEKVLQEAMEMAEEYASCGDFLVVHSPLAADVPESWATSGARRVLSHLGAMEVRMPGLDSGLIEELDEMDLDLPLALTQRNLLPRYMRHGLLAWEVNFCEELAKADALLLPTDDHAKRALREDSIFGKTLAI